MDPDSPVVLKSFDTEWAAELARVNLERAGIFTLVKQPAVQGFSGPPFIIVAAQDAPRALEVLEEFDKASKEEWICTNCGATVAADGFICPECGEDVSEIEEEGAEENDN